MTQSQVPSEQSLAARLREGDEEALRLLLDRYEDVVCRRIEQLLPEYTRRRVAASDVLQEARLVAHERKLDFEWRGEGSFRAWLMAIAENKARRALQRHVGVAQRSLRREVTRSRRLPTDQYMGRYPSPSEVAVGAELARFAQQALAALPPDYKEVLHLCREEGLTMREAAVQLGRSREATKKLYGRALARFTAIFNRMRGESSV